MDKHIFQSKSRGHRVVVFPLTNGRWRVRLFAGGKPHENNFSGEGAEDRAVKYAKTQLALIESGSKPASCLRDAEAADLFHRFHQTLGPAEMTRGLIKHASSISRGTEYSPPVEYVVKEFLRAQQDRSVRHLQTVRSHLTRFSDSFHKPISDVTSADIDSWLAKPGLSPKTRANFRISVVALFNFAKRKGHLPEDRLTAAERSERIKVPSSEEPDIYTPEEMLQLLQAAPDFMKAFLAIGAFAGARTAEIQRMTWGLWNPAERTLAFPSSITKTARRRVMTVEPNLAKWLNGLKRGPDERIVPVYNVHKFYPRIAEAAQTPWKPNGLRHSFASYHLERRQNPALTAKCCGHSIRKLETVYLKLTDPSTSKKWFSILPDNA